MPLHASWLTLLLAYVKDTLTHNAHVLGTSVINQDEATYASFEPIIASAFVVMLVLVLALIARGRLLRDDAYIPEDRLTLRTFLEVFLGYFYDLAKSIMDADRAKQHFPIIAGSACFVFFTNVLALLPGFPVATTSLNITLGSALVVFIYFNVQGLKSNGWGYLKHLAGPAWYLAWLIFPIELISLFVRPVTLAVRLMLNMAVDHLILTIFLGLIAVLVPVPLMLLGCLIIIVQTLVFALLTTIYISLATEHEAEHH
jgi:F-type H+-transporting ATPase subunit a